MTNGYDYEREKTHQLNAEESKPNLTLWRMHVAA